MAKITVTYTYESTYENSGEMKEIVWTREGKSAHYFHDPEIEEWQFTCDDKMLVVNGNSSHVISFEFEGANEDEGHVIDEPVRKKGKKK